MWYVCFHHVCTVHSTKHRVVYEAWVLSITLGVMKDMYYRRAPVLWQWDNRGKWNMWLWDSNWMPQSRSLLSSGHDLPTDYRCSVHVSLSTCTVVADRKSTYLFNYNVCMFVPKPYVKECYLFYMVHICMLQHLQGNLNNSNPLSYATRCTIYTQKGLMCFEFAPCCNCWIKFLEGLY